jgi:hypothetical protein
MENLATFFNEISTVGQLAIGLAHGVVHVIDYYLGGNLQL